jgi:hypothetical protein
MLLTRFGTLLTCWRVEHAGEEKLDSLSTARLSPTSLELRLSLGPVAFWWPMRSAVYASAPASITVLAGANRSPVLHCR